MKVCYVVLALVLASPAVAAAGPFGGFASDGRYLVSGERLCKPVTGGVQAPSCEKLTAAAVAKLSLERPSIERGSKARFTATTSGTKLTVTGQGATAGITWDAGSPIGKVRALYVNKAATVTAIEYETRFGGRTVIDVVGLRIAKASPSKTPASSKPTAKAPPTAAPSGPKLSGAQKKKFDAHVVAGWKQLKRKRWAKASAAASAALGIDDQSAEALAILAAAKARAKDTEATLVALERLASSSDPSAPEYRVEARTAVAFESLRANPRFRKAVGITPDPKRPLTAYERLMGFGGKWEQRLIQCEQPQVKLRLRRTRKRFSLLIKSRCGATERTDLDGTWRAVGNDELKMSFPNQGADDEGLTCGIERCRDSSGEDCVRCRVDEDLEFLLRVIRR